MVNPQQNIKCQKCGSRNVKFYKYIGIKTLKCNNCGFDERSVYEVYPEQKKSQKAKGRYNVYKAGGSQRARKAKLFKSPRK